MPRPFLQNAAFLLLVNLLIKPIFIFGIDMVVQNRVGPEAYGTYFALFNFAFLFNVLLDFGINNFNQRLVARDPTRPGRWLPNILWIKLALSAAYVLAVFGTAALLGFESQQMYLLVWIALDRVLISFHLFFRSNVSGMQAFRTDAWLSVADRLLTILLVGALLYSPLLGRPINILDFVYATAAALSLTALLSFVAMRRLSGPISLAWNSRMLRVVLLRAYPFALLGALMTLYNRVDGVMLERMLGPDGDREAGIYAAAYRLLDAGTMFAFLLSGILLPLFARMRKTGQDVWPVARSGARLLLAVAGAASAVGIAYAGPIMNALYTGADAYWGRLFALLIGGFVFNALVYVYGSLLTAENRLMGLNRIAVAGVLLNVGLNLWLIPRHQALGAAAATLATQGIVAVAHLLLAGRVFSWRKVMLREAALAAAYAGLLLALALMLSRLELPWLLGAALLALGGGLSALALRLLDLRELFRGMKSQSNSLEP
jgi:O-antigen/teichoic acid export membrane protein